MPRTYRKKKVKKVIKAKYKKCLFKEQKIEYVDYKDFEILKNFVSMNSGKILPRKLIGTSTKYQRKVAKAIKLAREIGFLNFKI